MSALSRRALSDIRVLVVDDDDDSREVAGAVLRMYGATVALAESATAALDLLRVVRPDVLISDLSMPVMDGFELCREIKKRPSSANLPVAALSGLAAPSDRAHALAAGFADHMPKPMEPENLVRLVYRLATHRQLGAAV